MLDLGEDERGQHGMTKLDGNGNFIMESGITTRRTRVAENSTSNIEHYKCFYPRVIYLQHGVTSKMVGPRIQTEASPQVIA